LTGTYNDIRAAITIDVACGHVDAEIEVRREGEERILQGVSQAAGINSYKWSGAGTRASDEIVRAQHVSHGHPYAAGKSGGIGQERAGQASVNRIGIDLRRGTRVRTGYNPGRQSVRGSDADHS